MKGKNAALLTLTAAAALTAIGYVETRYVAGHRETRDPIMHDSPDLPPKVAEVRRAIRAARRKQEKLPWRRVSIRSADGLILSGSFLPYPDKAAVRGTVLFAHGYRSSQNDFALALETYRSRGFHILMIDQRAHGKSEGSYIGFGALERGDVVLWAHFINEYLHVRLPIFLAGLSMGATTVLMASELTLPKNVCGIIADCGFTSCGEIVRKVMRDRKLPVALMYPLFRPACRLFAGFDPDGYSTTDAVGHCRVPVLFIHGMDDDFVPCTMTVRAYFACRSEKDLLLVPGARHGYAYAVDPEGYEAALDRFLEKCLRGDAARR